MSRLNDAITVLSNVICNHDTMTNDEVITKVHHANNLLEPLQFDMNVMDKPRYQLEFKRDYVGYFNCMTLVRELDSRNDNGHYINATASRRHPVLDGSDLYDVISKLCEEADKILTEWWGEGWYDEYVKEERETKHATEDRDESE